ncbi:TRAFAC clade GTPase domain-containing protein [Almyronema epifaneia]|uniref:Double-GTPase 1 domain-containing protein n=1 Tax=Almyronema epifaneia S1 TaxID=2991925 RepID=A0ABW6ICP8_9CYAN
MMNLFRQLNRPLPPQTSREIRIVGPRRAGKTTFLAALARFPNVDPNGPIQLIVPRDEATAALAEMAKDILETGSDFAPTDFSKQPLYSFEMTLKPSLWSPRSRNATPIRVTCREYAGELLQHLVTNRTAPEIQDYIEDCSFASGLILLVDATASQADAEYASAFEILQRELKPRLKSQGTDLSTYRISTVFSKCEQNEIWVHRKDIRRFQTLKFDETTAVISAWTKDWGCTTNSFFCSAFGFKSRNPPEPNVQILSRSQGVTRAMIASPEFWRPTGLAAPLYWLQTGSDHPKLREV